MLGDILREARKAKGLTLSELAERVEVTTGYLSHLERGKMEPSLGVLSKLSQELSIPISLLFEEQQTEEVIVTKQAERPKIRYRNLVSECEALTPINWRSEPTELEVIRMVLPPKSRLTSESMSHDSDECIYVAKGELEYRYGSSCYIIETGGSIYIPKKTGHYIYNNGNEEAEVYWIVKS